MWGGGGGTGGGRLLILGQDLRPLSERDGCRGEGPDTCCKQNAPPKKKKRKTEQQQQIDPILNIFPLLHTDTNDGIQTNPNMRPEVIKKYVHREK